MSKPCIVCGQPIPPDEERRGGWPYYVCSSECGHVFKAEVQRRARAQQPRLYAAKDAGEEMVLDPWVGDEYAIARLSLESRIGDDLTRPWRTARMQETCRALGVPPELAPAMVILADRQAGMNFVELLIDGRPVHAYQSGGGKLQEPIAGYFWERVPGGWQEHRPDDDPYPRLLLSDAELRAPKYGDVAGASALSWPEHFQPAEEDRP